MSGIAPEKLPEIVPCTAILGSIKPDVAKALGLAAGVQVVAGAIDNTAAAVGSSVTGQVEVARAAGDGAT